MSFLPPVVKTHETLFKRGSKGEVRIWFMEIAQVVGGQAGHRVVSGILNGTETRSGWTLTTPKNVGKKNETTSLSQAESDVINLYKIKQDRGYFLDVNEIDNVPFTKPMLATKWEDRVSKIDIAKGVYEQPKLDGIRCIARADGLWSRTGQKLSVSCDHIFAALAPVFEADPDTILDGELYNHDLKDDFNTITSLVRKESPTAEELEQAVRLIQYHVYDIPSSGTAPFDERYGDYRIAVAICASPSIVAVPASEVFSLEELDAKYAYHIKNGYEGQMGRINAEYEHKRSKYLMKRKDWITTEFPVVSMHEGEGNWAGCIKMFTVQVSDTVTSGATPKGNRGTLKALLEYGKVPDWATVKFFGYTEDGLLRFPNAVDWGYGERTD